MLTEIICKENPFIDSMDIHKNVENFTSGILEAAKQSIPKDAAMITNHIGATG